MHTYQALVYIRLFKILADTRDESFAVLKVCVKVGNVSNRGRRRFNLRLFIGKVDIFKLMNITDRLVKGRHLACVPDAFVVLHVAETAGLPWPYPTQALFIDKLCHAVTQSKR